MMIVCVLIFAALLSCSYGEDRQDLYGSILNKAMNIGQDVSSLMVESSGTRYLGCYTDKGDRMIDAKYRKQINHLTHEWCFNYCREDGYKYAGLQFSNECFCGNTIDTKKYPKRPESECNKACRGNAKEVCGGGLRNSLFKLY